MRSSKEKTLEEIVNADDSADEDYDDRNAAPFKARPSRRSRNRPGVKPSRKPRDKYRGSDVDSDSDDVDLDDDDSFGEDDEEEVETNEKGRPVRRTAKKPVKYEEESSGDELAQTTSASSGDEEEEIKPVRRRRQQQSLKITLHYQGQLARTKRSTRLGSGRPGSSAHPTTARRSSRLSHDEEEPIVALTNSGNHVEVVRQGSHDPEALPPRSTRGGKGLKHPSKSTIDEETEESQNKDEEMDELEIKASQHPEVEPETQMGEDEDQNFPRLLTDLGKAAEAEPDSPDPLQKTDQPDPHSEQEEDDDDDMPVTRGRSTRSSNKRKADSAPPDSPQSPKRPRRNLRSAASGSGSKSRRRKGIEESSDFDPDEAQEGDVNMSSSDESAPAHRKNSQNDDSSNGGRRSNRLRSKAVSRQSPASDEDEADDIAAELAELKRDGKKPRRAAQEDIIFETRGKRSRGKKPNYDLLRNLAPIEDDDEPAAPSPSQRARKVGGGAWQRSLFPTHGPFGGTSGPPALLGGQSAPRAQGDVDSDSSDDEVMKQPRPVGGSVGMTPTTAGPSGGFNLFPQVGADQAPAGTPANLGKVKDKKALADADPLGVDQNVNFDGVGGLQGHIDQLKEMVALPLLYPEIFMRFKITPPRGVLFHGPPGTGKTLLARALASSVSSQGRKVTFYMRKGADALSKWVGEAERQLRLLFDEARKTQPSIIFFDEIDGLAPVRSSKQEQIHASIVSTLLALMDGMDGRGQVIVIGATNRPDSIDPALRRPGRFDREFYFPLPNVDARRAIIDIHTRGWDPPLTAVVKDDLASLTKGYGGADLRALCTEAALNAVQRRYPQIYASNEKLLIDPTSIKVTPKDFMISVKKMVPSSERSASSGAASLPAGVVPLLQRSLTAITELLDEIMPRKKSLTALEEARYEDDTGNSFLRERMQQAFETARVFRPRLLVHGKLGMGQQYLAGAILNHFEGFHVQSLDLPVLYGDSTSSPEATIIRLFSEVKMHKPSVIFIPNVQEWYATVGSTVISTFLGLLRSIKPTDPILLLGILESDVEQIDDGMRRELFGYSQRNCFSLPMPTPADIQTFFEPIKRYVKTRPDHFPDPANRKKRQLETLPTAPPEAAKPVVPPTKQEQKAQRKRDRQTLNLLKIRLQPIMDQIRTKYRKFRTGVIDENQIRYLFEEADPEVVTSDLPAASRATFRPFEVGKDAHDVPGLVEQASGKFFYNLDTVTIEKRLSNGWYKRPKDFLADIRRLAKDAKMIGDEERELKANELLTNVEVDIDLIELNEAALAAECDRVYERELARETEMLDRARADAAANQDMPPPQVISNVPHNTDSLTSGTTLGPIKLGVHTDPRGIDILSRLHPVTPSRPSTTSLMTNGIHKSDGTNTDERTNGTTSSEGHRADVENDTAMVGTDSVPTSGQKSQTTSSFDNRASAQPKPYYQMTAPSQEMREKYGDSAPLSQTGGLTAMKKGSSAADYLNSASSTDTPEAKRNSAGSSGQQQSTQESGPNLFNIDETLGQDLPATQPGKSIQDLPPGRLSTTPWENYFLTTVTELPNSQSSQLVAPPRKVAIPVPPIPTPTWDAGDAQGIQASRAIQQQRRPSTDLQALLNPAEEALVLPSEQTLDAAVNQIATSCVELTVEQLEQVNSVLMEILWQTRNEWDRENVLGKIVTGAHQVRSDMRTVGQDMPPSSNESY
jgi:ATPase family AAA domain-containing protein 2